MGDVQESLWRSNFKLPERWWSKGLADRKHFNFYLMTDGVAVSVIMGKWIDPATATQREEQEQQGEWNRLGRMLESQTPRCIGIDPGRKDWVAYAEDEMNENEEIAFEDA